MGCGQSKINIYPKKSKGKNSSKKSVTGDKPEGEEEDGAENERNANEQSDDDGSDECDSKKKPGRTKPIGNVGGPLLAQTELSNSQHNFFKMLDEKIENGPDYDSNDETEIALETARLHTLLKDWETASASSRSLPSTPRHVPRQQHHHHPQDRNIHSAPKLQQQQQLQQHTRIPPNVIHQTYGVTPPMAYRQTNYNPTYQTHSPTHTPQYIPPNVSKIQPGIQYQDYQAPSYQMHHQSYLPRQYTHPLPNQIPNAVPSSGSPVHYQTNNSPKHKYAQQQPQVVQQQVVQHPAHQGHQGLQGHQGHQGHQGVAASIAYGSVVSQGSPTHKMYVAPQNAGYTNGELIIQQQLYNQQLQYQQSREYQQYRQNREQLLVQQQICGPPGIPIPQGAYSVGVGVGVGVGVPGPTRAGSHYQSSVHVPIVAVLPQNDQSPKMLQRKQQRQYSQEMT